MSRKLAVHHLRPLPKRPAFCRDDNQSVLLLALLREVALSSQAEEAQSFYPLREVTERWRISLSRAAALYRELECEGLLRCMRGSGTILQGRRAHRKVALRGVIALPVSLPLFFTRQSYRAFVMTLRDELWKRDFAAAEAFFETDESAAHLAGRLAQSRPEKAIWYCPERIAREVAARLRDRGIPLIGVSDRGVPGIPCRYQIRRERAMAKIAAAWKQAKVARIKVAVGPADSTWDEEAVERVLDEVGLEIQFIRMGSQSV